MKSALIFTMYYWPELTGIAPLARDLAEQLGELGWKVTVVTGFPMMPDWAVFPEYRGKAFMHETKAATNIYRSWVYVPKKPKLGMMKTWKRVLFDTSLIVTALPKLLSSKSDVVVAIGPPLQTGFASLLLKKLWGCPVLYWLQDIVPDAALNVGMMKAGTALKVARWMEQKVYRGVDRIGIISEGFRLNLLTKGVPEEKQVFLPNWANMRRFDETPPGHGRREALGIPASDFVILHAGSMGAKQALENALLAAREIGPGHGIRLIFLGGGNRAEAIKSEARRLNLDCVTFVPTVVDAEYVSFLRMADLLLINQASDVVEALIPSKLLTYLPSARPVIAAVNSESETARFLAKAQCALVVEPDNPKALASGILQLKNDPAGRLRMGAAGAAFIRSYFDKPVLLGRFIEVLENITAPVTHR